MLEKEKKECSEKQFLCLGISFKSEVKRPLWENMAPDMIVGDTFFKNGIIKWWFSHFSHFSPLAVMEGHELG